MKLKIVNYNKKIKNKIILDNINLEFISGKVYGFYGRNGSGKTMLFRAISTLIFPDSGDVLVDDKSILYNDYDLRNFGLVLDESNFYSYLTGIENLKILYSINNKVDEQHILKLMHQIGLKDGDEYKKVKEYSLGMNQKLRILQAIMEEQKIIILDEPTNGLDEKSIDIVRNIIKKLKKENKLILIASHNKDDLRILCDKIYKIDSGAIVGEIKL